MSLNLNFPTSEMGTIEAPSLDYCTNSMTWAPQLEQIAQEMHPMSPTISGIGPCLPFPIPSDLLEVIGLKEITDTSTFSSSDYVLGKYSHSPYEQQGKGSYLDYS